jgi:hypothetical protein
MRKQLREKLVALLLALNDEQLREHKLNQIWLSLNAQISVTTSQFTDIVNFTI